jgi:hypothetical protein
MWYVSKKQKALFLSVFSSQQSTAPGRKKRKRREREQERALI